MTMDMDAAKRAKKALTTKPKWSFGSIRYWSSKLKRQTHIKFKKESIPKFKQTLSQSTQSGFSKFLTQPLQIILGIIMCCFTAIFCVPVLLYGIFKSIQTNRKPTLNYRVTHKKIKPRSNDRGSK